MKKIFTFILLFMAFAHLLLAQQPIRNGQVNSDIPSFLKFGAGSRGEPPRLDSIVHYQYATNDQRDSTHLFTTFFQASMDTFFYTSYTGTDRVHPNSRWVTKWNSVPNAVESFSYKFRTFELYDRASGGIWKTQQYYRYHWNELYPTQRDSSYFVVFDQNAQALYSQEWCNYVYDATRQLVVATNCNQKNYEIGSGFKNIMTSYEYDAENRLIQEKITVWDSLVNETYKTTVNIAYAVDTVYTGYTYVTPYSAHFDSTMVVETTSVHGQGRVKRSSTYKWRLENQVKVWKLVSYSDSEYDSQGRLIAIDDSSLGGNGSRFRQEYTYEYDEFYSTASRYIESNGNAFHLAYKEYFFYTDTTPNAVQPLVRISPNPTTNSIQAFSDVHIQSARLYDAQGRLVHTKENVNKYSFSLDRSAFPNGVYVLRLLMANGAILARKIVLI